MQALQWRGRSPRWGLIAPINSPCKTRSALSLDDPSRIINFGTPRNIRASYFSATADSQSTITGPNQGFFVKLVIPIEG